MSPDAKFDLSGKTVGKKKKTKWTDLMTKLGLADYKTWIKSLLKVIHLIEEQFTLR